MRIFIVLLILCFSSCESSKTSSEEFIQNVILDCISLIGMDVPNTYSYETENKYTRLIEKNQENPVEMNISLIVESDIVESCNVTITLSDFDEAREYYDFINKYLKKDNWLFIKFISKYKRPNGTLYSKNDIYFGVYEPTPLAVPMCFSKDINLSNFYEPKMEMIYDITYYKTKIIEYRNFFDERQEISSIIEIDNIFPGLLSFLVCWNDNLKGYIYELYTFDKNQNIVKKYLVGIGPLLNQYRDILMEKISGSKIEYGLISFADFNHNGYNEIISYSLYPNMGYVVSVFEYSIIENDLVQICLVPVYINFEKPFSPVEYLENGFRILEIVDNEYLELVWNKYEWDLNSMKYIRK
jgi:hypothetical protein